MLFLIQLGIERLWLPDQRKTLAGAGPGGLGDFPFPQEMFPRGDFPWMILETQITALLRDRLKVSQ